MDGLIPARYKRWAYFCTRIVVPFFAGTVPMIMGAESPLVAFCLGASAPLIVDKLAEGVMPKMLPDCDSGSHLGPMP